MAKVIENGRITSVVVEYAGGQFNVWRLTAKSLSMRSSVTKRVDCPSPSLERMPKNLRPTFDLGGERTCSAGLTMMYSGKEIFTPYKARALRAADRQSFVAVRAVIYGQVKRKTEGVQFVGSATPIFWY